MVGQGHWPEALAREALHTSLTLRASVLLLVVTTSLCHTPEPVFTPLVEHIQHEPSRPVTGAGLRDALP